MFENATMATGIIKYSPPSLVLEYLTSYLVFYVYVERNIVKSVKIKRN